MKWSIPERIIERGRDYLKENRVLSAVPDAENQVWRAEVLGSELYRIDLDATAKEEDYCQCPYWEEHHFCKHTVAVELYLRQKGLTRQIQGGQAKNPATFSPSEMFTKGFYRLQEEQQALAQVVPLEIQCQVDQIATNPYRKEFAILGVSLKLGEKTGRKYVIRNIYKFLQVYHEAKIYNGIKQGSYYLHPQAFTAAENDLLARLVQIAQTQQLLGQIGVQVNGQLDKKYLLLPVHEGKELLEKMQEVDFLFQADERRKKALVFTEEAIPLSFSLKAVDEGFELVQDSRFDQLYQAYQWGMLGEKVYSLSTEALEVYLTTMQLMKRLEGPKISYTKPELSLLFRQVLPFLRKIGEVKIAPEVYAAISEAPLEMIFYFRRKQGMIDVRVDFRYGEIVYSTHADYTYLPLDAPEVLRDYQGEKRVAQLLEQFDFQQGKQGGWQKPIPKGTQLYQFFTHEVPVFRQLGKVHLGKKLRELYLDGKDFAPVIAVDQEDSWLNVSFDISGIDEEEVQAILQSLLRQEAFYTLQDGKVLSLTDDRFQETSQMLQQLRAQLRSDSATFEVPLYQGLQLQEQLGEQANLSHRFEDLTQHLIQPESFAAALPQGIQADLREYQIQGFRWLKMLSHYHFGGILADEMGLGKTLQTITFLLSEKEEKGKIQTLIVTPASLTYNWQQEFKRFAPDLKSVVVHGTKEEREQLLATEQEIFITSYTSLRQDVSIYQEQKFDYLILDEAQMVKNSYTKTAQALQSLVIPRKFALSGTPIENNLEELWGLFQLIMPGFFPSRQKYRELTTEEIARMIQPFVLRRDKTSVLQDLPEKIERNYYSGLTEEQKKVYLAYLQQMRAEVSSMDSATFRKSRISILAGLTRLRQICCDPHLFLEDYKGSSGKLEQAKDLIETAIKNKRRILLFSQFTGMLSILEETLNQMGISTFYLRGSTPPKHRVEMVNAFNAGEKEVFLISLKAGGTGLNLTGADTVILYDLWWNPAVEEQAAGRAHRMGQKKVVEVWRMIAEGTIEERMEALQQEKRELFQKVIQGNETQLQQLTEDDIRLILSVGEASNE
ncbi:DEAD/DEAH box helicase [Enterococcus sp. LJL98]